MIRESNAKVTTTTTIKEVVEGEKRTTETTVSNVVETFKVDLTETKEEKCKFVLIKIKKEEEGVEKIETIFVSRNKNYHSEIVSEVLSKIAGKEIGAKDDIMFDGRYLKKYIGIENSGINYNIAVCGGGFVSLSEEEKTISISGESCGYGKRDWSGNRRMFQTLRKAIPDYKVFSDVNEKEFYNVD